MQGDTIRVLVADDDRGRMDTLRDVLSDGAAATFEVITATRLDDAIDVLTGGGVDVVLADLTLEDSAGLPTLAILLTYAGGAPVLVLSESVDDPVPLRALQQGAHDQLPRDQLYPTPVIRSIRYAVEQSRAVEALRESEQRYRTLFQQSRDAIFVTDERDQVLELNRAALELFEYRAEEIVGKDLRRLFRDPADYDELARQLTATGSVRELEVRMSTSEGRELWCLVAATARSNGAGRIVGWQGIVHDVTERKRAELRLEHDALHDVLTGLPNRTLFMDRLAQAVRRSARGDGPGFALLFLDLDRFKNVNDTLGHEAGDTVLRRTAGLLRSCVRPGDTVGRLGGDEFVVLLEGIEGVTDATQVADRMLLLMNRPYRVRDREFFTTGSIGISWPSEGSRSAESLLREADMAMYQAKAQGGGRYRVFDPDMHRAAVSQLEVESDLRHALGRDEFVLVYQPILSFDTGRTTGFEALARWNHPQRGLLLPGSFIPLAEETALIVPLGLWAIRHAARQLRTWREGGDAPERLMMSINLSPRQFVEPDLVEQVTRILKEERVRPWDVMLEITETALMQDPDQAAHKLEALRRAGIRVCLDDFGTGYSSLAYLRRFPLDSLKVDRSFVRRLDDSPRDRQLVASITSLARNLGIGSIVEGVETPDQLARLRRLRPREVQGFLFSRPVDPESAARFLVGSNPELRGGWPEAVRACFTRLRLGHGAHGDD